MGFSTEGDIEHKIYVHELKEIVTGVNCLFSKSFYELIELKMEECGAV